ncbi:HPC2 multi-domain protein [Streptomyces sp. NPDC057702]|uniref:phage tail protein n=1 Tax=unclassified Streptomyces TaxID=2593676 RepID=UPI0036B04F46
MKSTPDVPSTARQRPHPGVPAMGQHTGAVSEVTPATEVTPGVSRAVRTPPTPVPGGPSLDRRGLHRLQRAAGNAAVSRLVAQRYAAPVKPSPAQAPGFRRVKADVGTKKQTVKRHQPATTESRSAQDAAVAPPDDREAQGKAAQAEKMNAAKPGEFDKQAFIDAVNKAIADQAPKNLNEADKFADSGKADQVKEQVNGKVTDGKKTSAKDIETTTRAAPDTSKAKSKKVTPMTADKPPGNPGAPSANDAVPDKQPPAVTDFSDGPKQNDKAMADAEVTEEQLAKGNEPQFDEALSEKKKAEEDARKAGPASRRAEDAELADAKAGAAAAGASAMASLTATRGEAGQKVDGGKGETKSKDEKKREEVTAKLQKVFDATRKDVESTLEGLDKKVDDQFTKGEKAAKDAFTDDHKRRMKKYKDKRYSGFRGKLRWVKDKFKGLPEEGLNIFKESRKLYVSKMRGVISSIADTIGTELGKAKARIKQGRSELKAEVDKLPEDLKKYGQEAAKDFEGKFEDLETKVNEKSDELVQTLAQKYTEALNKVDEEIKKLQDANKGLIAKARDAIVGAIKTIMELKNLLMGILAKAASAIGKIIKDPIGFLGNLVKAVSAGLNLFTSNILDHLKKGLVAWLLGTATKEGIEIPAKFDMKGIIQLVGSMLGLTWDNLRARIVAKGVPEPAMEKVEQSVPVAGALSREGPAGAMDEIQADTGDLKTKILDDLKAYLVPTVIIAGISWIVSLLTPASAFVRAVKGIIDIITFIVNQGAQIVEFVNAVLDAVIAIAGGGSAGVPKMVEAALAASIPLLIGFLAALVGVGGLANKVKSVLRAAGRPVKRAIDKLVGVIARKGKAIWGRLRNSAGKKKEKQGDARRKTDPKRDPKGRARKETDSKGGSQKRKQQQPDGSPERARNRDSSRRQSEASDSRESKKSEDVKRLAREMLSAPTAKPLGSKQELETIVANVFSALRPQGLRSLKATQAGTSDRYVITAKASPASTVGVASLSTAEKKEIIRAAIKAAKDSNESPIIRFLQKMTAGETITVRVSGKDYKVDLTFFTETWADAKVRADVGDKFRSAVDGHHEWIPTEWILAVVERARDVTNYTDGAEWLKVHHGLRSHTQYLVYFNPKAQPRTASKATKKYSIPQGHVGAVYFTGRIGRESFTDHPMTRGRYAFHSSLGSAFKNSSTIKEAVSELRTRMEEWIWNGNDSYPYDIHPGCKDKDKQAITANDQQRNFSEVVKDFDKWS